MYRCSRKSKQSGNESPGPAAPAAPAAAAPAATPVGSAAASPPAFSHWACEHSAMNLRRAGVIIVRLRPASGAYTRSLFSST